MWDKVRKRIVDACDVMDMVMAAVVVIGIVIAVIGIFRRLENCGVTERRRLRF